jgi:hypothetical protein
MFLVEGVWNRDLSLSEIYCGTTRCKADGEGAGRLLRKIFSDSHVTKSI